MSLPRRTQAAAAAGVVLAGSLLMIFTHRGGAGAPGPTGKVYFYDVQARQLFAGPPMTPGPIVAPSGGEGVRAYVFACGDCAAETNRHIAWLEKLTPDAAAEMRKPIREREPSIIAAGALVGEVDRPGDWFPAESAQAIDIQQRRQKPCADLVECSPS